MAAMVKVRGATKFFIVELLPLDDRRWKRTRHVAAGTHASGVAVHTTGPVSPDWRRDRRMRGGRVVSGQTR
jgi:hypothetical protein